MKINPVYVLMLVGLLVMVPFTRQLQLRPTTFYGIAENPDLDLSLDQAAWVNEILVKEGQTVTAGETLAILEQRTIPFLQASLEQDQQRVRAERNEVLTERDTRISELQQARKDAIFEIENKITERQAVLARNEQLLSSLESMESSQIRSNEDPELSALQSELATIGTSFDLQIQHLSQETNAELQSLDTRFQQLAIEDSEIERQVAELVIKAPVNGVIGNVNFIPGEQIEARATIVNIYQLHPNQVTTYIPEGLLTNLQMGDLLSVSSLQDTEYTIQGEIIGLGNKIRELPVRMRRDPNVQAWGREVLLQISPDNALMQGERVLVEQIEE